MATVEVGEAREVWSAIAAESTALNAVGSLDTAEVGSLASASKTSNIAERSTDDGAAGCWDSTTIVVGVAEWHTWITLAADTLAETTVDDGSGCVVSVVDLLAVVSKTLRVADLGLTGWLELDGLCCVSSTVILTRYVSRGLGGSKSLVGPQVQMFSVGDIAKCRQLEVWYTSWFCLLAKDSSSKALAESIGNNQLIACSKC